MIRRLLSRDALPGWPSEEQNISVRIHDLKPPQAVIIISYRLPELRANIPDLESKFAHIIRHSVPQLGKKVRYS